MTQADFNVNELKSGIQKDPQVVTLPSGGFFVTWCGMVSNQFGNLIDSRGIMGRRFSFPINSPAFTEIYVNTTDQDIQESPNIGVFSTGHFIIIWQSENQDYGGLGIIGIYGQRFDQNCNKEGIEFLINVTEENKQEIVD